MQYDGTGSNLTYVTGSYDAHQDTHWRFNGYQFNSADSDPNTSEYGDTIYCAVSLDVGIFNTVQQVQL